MDDATATAVGTANTFNASLLTAARDEEYETLLASFKQQQVLLDESRGKISELQIKITTLDEEVILQKDNALREARRSKNWEEKDRDSQERLARVEVEADSLRQEIRYDGDLYMNL